MLALGLNEVLPLGFCEVFTALPDALLPVGVELTVEDIGHGYRQSSIRASSRRGPRHGARLRDVQEGSRGQIVE